MAKIFIENNLADVVLIVHENFQTSEIRLVSLWL